MSGAGPVGGGELGGRVALVLGAGRGIGAAVAEQLAAAGARTAVVARRRADVDALADRLSGTGEVLPLTYDLADAEQAVAAVREVGGRLGPVTLLVNNAAAVTPVSELVRTDLAHWRRTLLLNLLAPVAATHTALPGMLTAGFGRIVNVSTGAAGGTGMPNGNAYSTSKAGLEMHSVNLATELAGSGVSVCAVRPGRVDTDMQSLLRSDRTANDAAAMAARARAFLADGELLDPAVPATLVVRAMQAGTTGVLSVYDETGRRLLHDLSYPGDGR